MKRIELLFSAILVPVDYCMIIAAGLSAYAVRFGGTVTDIRPVFYELPIGEFLNVLLLAALAWVVIFAISGMYTMRGHRRFRNEFATILTACSTGTLAIIVLFFFQREFFSSRFILLTGLVFAVFYVTLGRLIVRSIQRLLLRRGVGVYRIALIGKDQVADQLVELYTKFPELGYRVVARFPEVTDAAMQELARLASERLQHEERGIDMVLEADSRLPKEQLQTLIDFCNDTHTTLKYTADMFGAKASNLAVETMGGIPIIEIKKTRLDGWGRILKRMFDLVLATLALIVLSPVFVIVAIAIKLDSRGPVFIRLTRVGERGRLFPLFKFRSMVQNAHAMKAELMQFNERTEGPLFKMKNDPRITRVGRFIRRTSIDELPQFWNVIRGEMSLVGPRPHEPEEVARYERPHRQLLTIKPGITGLAQVSGRSDLQFATEARLDIFYIEHWSLFLDLSILVRTPFVVLQMKSAA